jgi:uncharacterized membrane protein
MGTAIVIWTILIVFAALMLSPVLYGIALGVRALFRALCRLVAAGFRRAKAR